MTKEKKFRNLKFKFKDFTKNSQLKKHKILNKLELQKKS